MATATKPWITFDVLDRKPILPGFAGPVAGFVA